MTRSQNHVACGPRLASDAGFTIVELLVASLIMIVVTGTIFSLMNPAQVTYRVQPEVSDLQQRLRISVDTLQKDLVMAGAGTYNGDSAGALTFFIAPVMPYVAFGDSTDPENGVFFRDDVISLLYVPPTPSHRNVTPIRNTRRRPKMSPSRPPVTSSTANVRV